jgi:putative hydrolase of the HAD superfamily
VSAIPWDRLDTLFLDVGNTLVSVDFDWIARELDARGVRARPEEVRRAEAAARPAISSAIERRGATEGTDAFRFYLGAVLARLDAARALGEAGRNALGADLAPVLRGAPGEANRLWSWVIPGVPEALAALRGGGYRLVAVSNSDGSAERGLVRAGLRGFLEAVVDSHHVGFEKPDPRIFAHALELASADPERTLHVGDMYHADVAGARAAGVHPLLLDPFGDWDHADCERVADLAELAARLPGRR